MYPNADSSPCKDEDLTRCCFNVGPAPLSTPNPPPSYFRQPIRVLLARQPADHKQILTCEVAVSTAGSVRLSASVVTFIKIYQNHFSVTFICQICVMQPRSTVTEIVVHTLV